MLKTLVRTRYQTDGDEEHLHHRDGVAADVLRSRAAARCTAPTETSDEVLSMLMNSLPVGGTITRIACGSTIRRMVLPVGHAERVRRLGLALVDRLDAGPDDLRHVRGLVEAEAEQGGHERRHDVGHLVLVDRPEVEHGEDQREVEPQQQLHVDRGAAEEPDVAARPPQLVTGFFDSRITARTTPSTRPMTIDSTLISEGVADALQDRGRRRSSRRPCPSVMSALREGVDERGRAARARPRPLTQRP